MKPAKATEHMEIAKNPERTILFCIFIKLV